MQLVITQRICTKFDQLESQRLNFIYSDHVFDNLLRYSANQVVATIMVAEKKNHLNIKEAIQKKTVKLGKSCIRLFVVCFQTRSPSSRPGLWWGFKLYISSASLLLITPEMVRFLGASARPRGW